MEYILVAIAVVAFLALLCFSLIFAIEGSFVWGVVFTIAFTLLVAGLIWQADKEEKGPCVEYETTMMFNAGTKTTMPVKYCVKRGEWVE